MAIHQLLPGFCYGDAISNHAMALKRLLRSWGYPSEIYARLIHPKVADQCRPFRDFKPDAQTVTIYHYSIGAAELTERFLDSPGKRMLIYHNITPPAFFAPYSDEDYQDTKKGREVLGEFRTAVDMVLADSEYNCQELAELGFQDPRPLPILVDFRRFQTTPPCPLVLRQFADDWTNFLFVGRIAPNKRHDDVIRAFVHYNRFINRRSRLLLVGSFGGMEGYLADLQQLARFHEIEDHLIFAGHVRFRELLAYYAVADLFLCMSEHEGFCVPLVEAMYHDIPILAYQATAIPDTLGEAGVLVRQKNFAQIAEMAHLLVSDRALRAQVLARQRARVACFQPERIAARFRTYLSELLGTPCAAAALALT
jgi:glycosyltransferase involved in cell wall biosynthesis